MDKSYFKNYGGKGIDYKKSWENFLPLHPKEVVKYFYHLKNFKPYNVFDVGAADGTVLREYRKLGIKGKGIEIYKNIIKDKNIEHYDVRDYEFKDFYDIIQFNGLGYLTKEEIIIFFKKIKKFCKYGLFSFEFWETVDRKKIYEKTVLPYSEWVRFLSSICKIEFFAKGTFIVSFEGDFKEIDLSFKDYIIPTYYKNYIDLIIGGSKKERINIRKQTLSVKGKKLNLDELVQLNYFVSQFSVYDVIVKGLGFYKNFKPGWSNNLDGSLNLYKRLNNR